MKKIILSVLVSGLVITASQAQEIPDREPQKQRMMHKHHRSDEFRKLNLTEEQKAKFKALHEENRKQMAELKKNDNITVKEWRSQMEAQRREHREKMQSLLTDEQKAQLEKSKLERKEKYGHRSGERAEKMKAELGLSDEQTAKLKGNREAMAEKIKTIRENQSLTDDVKREQVKELMKTQKDELKTILTEEQLKKWEEQKKQRPSRKKSV